MKRQLLTCLAFGFLISSAFARPIIKDCYLQYGGWRAGNNVFAGPTICNNASSPGISVAGPLTTSGTTFTGDVSVKGPTNAAHTHFKNIFVAGPLYMQTCSADNVKTDGPVVAQNSTLGNINSHSNYTSLSNTSVKSITIITDKTNHHNPKLHLQGKTTVSGNITFQGKPGLVLMGQQVRFNGKLTNGKIQHTTPKKLV